MAEQLDFSAEFQSGPVDLSDIQRSRFQRSTYVRITQFSPATPAKLPSPGIQKNDGPEPPQDGYQSRRGEGAMVGFAKGLQFGILLDGALLGIPILVGYTMNGVTGALVGGLIAPVTCGVLLGLQGFTDPERMLKN